MPSLIELVDIISTGGAIAVLVWMLWLLLTERVVPKGRLDDQKELTEKAMNGWEGANSANARLADTWEARNEAETRFRKAQEQ